MTTQREVDLEEMLRDIHRVAKRWCNQIETVGTGWDDWDHCYKEMNWEILPMIDKFLDIKEDDNGS